MRTIYQSSNNENGILRSLSRELNRDARTIDCAVSFCGQSLRDCFDAGHDGRGRHVRGDVLVTVAWSVAVVYVVV